MRLYSYHQLWVLVDYAMPGKHLKRKLFAKLNCNSYKDTEFRELNKSDVGELLKRTEYPLTNDDLLITERQLSSKRIKSIAKQQMFTV